MPEPETRPVLAPAPAEEELFLEVSVNGEASGLILQFTRDKTGLRSSVQNLRDLSLNPALFGLDGRQEFYLDRAKGLSYDYDAGRQLIALRVDDALRAPVELSARSVAQPMPASESRGAVLNYDAYTVLGNAPRAALANEVRYFAHGGVFSSDGVWNLARQQNQYLRYDTYWNHADPDTLQSWQVGDLITSSLSWSRSVRMGGVQWRKSFELRPDLLTYPVASLGGSAVVPSAVSLYINGVRQVETAVPSGPFIINQVAGINGAGQATLVTRDATGRAVSTTLPLYVDTRLLAEGLNDYSVELGALRRGYGVDFFHYAHTPSASVELRHGVNNLLTLETHAEAGRGIVNGGVGALLGLGQAGVVSASVSGSRGRATTVSGAVLSIVAADGTAGGGAAAADPVVVRDSYTSSGRGGQASLGYQYLSRYFSVDAQRMRAAPGFSDLGTADGNLGALGSDRLTLNLSLPFGQSLGLSYVALRSPLVSPARIISAAYSATLGAGLYLSVSAFRDLNDAKTRGVFVNLSMTFGDRISANASRANQNGVRSTAYSMSRAPDYGGGLGWGLQSVNAGGATTRQAAAQYLGNYGQLSALVVENASSRSTSLDLSGALVLMDGAVQAARQVGAGFALVSTDGVGGVPVLQSNRPIGKTDLGGHLLVPNLNPYLANLIAIDTSNLPIDARVAVSSQNVVPARLSGVLVRFPVEKYAAASVVLYGRDGKPVAAGTEVLHVESGNRTVVGFDGLAFIDHLQPLNHLVIGAGEGRCALQFAYAPERQQAMSVIGPYTCEEMH